MPVSVTMPRLGESVTEGTVTRWLKNEGEQVEADEPLLEVSTDKVDTEIPSPASGVLTAIKVGEDETVEVGVELATIDEAGTAAAPAPAKKAEAPQPSPEPAPQPAQAAVPAAVEEKPPAPAPAEERPAPQPAAAQQAQPARPAAPAPVAAATAPAPQSQAPAAQPAPQAQPASTAEAEEEGEDAGAYVTPLVRKLAAEHGVDLTGVKGTGV